MKQELINEILTEMLPFTDNGQRKQLQQVLEHVLQNHEIKSKDSMVNIDDSVDMVDAFIFAK